MSGQADNLDKAKIDREVSGSKLSEALGGDSAKIYKINNESDWAKRGAIGKRLHGFACYVACAGFALLWPEAVDMALYTELKKQFID